jgi:hypothetical protein
MIDCPDCVKSSGTGGASCQCDAAQRRLGTNTETDRDLLGGNHRTRLACRGSTSGLPDGPHSGPSATGRGHEAKALLDGPGHPVDRQRA